jgi:DNA-directed RNA polymerase specialized sigma24 family protein
MLVLREFQTVLAQSSPEEALVFQRYYLNGERDISRLAEELQMSPATVYRRLSRIRQAFLARRDALEPPHWAD